MRCGALQGGCPESQRGKEEAEEWSSGRLVLEVDRQFLRLVTWVSYLNLRMVVQPHPNPRAAESERTSHFNLILTPGQPSLQEPHISIMKRYLHYPSGYLCLLVRFPGNVYQSTESACKQEAGTSGLKHLLICKMAIQSGSLGQDRFLCQLKP